MIVKCSFLILNDLTFGNKKIGVFIITIKDLLFSTL